MKFNIGDRVRVTRGFFASDDRVKNQIGVIVAKSIIYDYYGVRFDVPNYFMHRLGGKCENNHGLWFRPESLTLVEESDEEEIELDETQVLNLL